jgi:phosphotriesterase-related protein
MKSLKRVLSITLLISITTFFVVTAAFAGQVMTVLGPVSSDDLGVTLMHEHMAFHWPGSEADRSVAPYDRDALEAQIMKVLNDVKAVGVNTIIDAGMCDVGGRDPILLKNLSKKSGINIIMSTGMYFEREGANLYFKYRQYIHGGNVEQELYDVFKTEITKGVHGTGIKAGVIKLASDAKITDFEKAVFKAGVRVAKETGVPIITHTQGPTVGTSQQELFLSLGMNPKKTVIGHQNNSDDINYHLSQLSRPGFYIAFDRTSLGEPWGKAKAEDCIIELVKRGYANRVMISHDSISAWPGRPYTIPDAVKPAVENWYPTYIHKKFIPKMKAAGVTDAQIETMLVDNIKRLFDEK